MHGVSTQQARPLEKVVFCRAAPHHHGTQPKAVAAIGFGDQYPSHETSDTTKPVQHHINGLVDRLLSGINQIIQFLSNILFNRQPFARSLS